MVNIYTGQLVKVLWNGVYSQNFRVINGVKQGSILSPVLFCVYIDELLLVLRYRVNGAYTATAVRRMLAVCDKFAVKLDVRFNASKSKCMFFFVRESHINHISIPDW